MEAVARGNVARNAHLYSTKAAAGRPKPGGASSSFSSSSSSTSRVAALPLFWGGAAEAPLEALFDSIRSRTFSGRVSFVLAADIAYVRPGFPAHFDAFMETLLKVIDGSAANGEREERERGEKGRRKKKGSGGKKGGGSEKGGKNSAGVGKELDAGGGVGRTETFFLYCHRRRMALSEDLLHLIYEEFEDVAAPIGAEHVDPKSFSAGHSPRITVHFLRRKRGRKEGGRGGREEREGEGEGEEGGEEKKGAGG